MTVTYEGLDCLKDQELPQYRAFHDRLQAAVPWVDQPKYGYYTLYFGCAFIIVALIKHFYYSCRDANALNSKWLQPVHSFVDVCTSYCRYFGYKRIPTQISYFTSLPPSLGSSLFLLGSSLYMFLWCLVPHFWYRGCRGFGSPPLAVRAGIMATALTPFIYILSGKTNFVTLVTGISYDRLNYIHQYVGVAALVLSVIHTIPFFHQALVEGGYANLKQFFDENFYFWSGVPPLILLFFLCTLSKSFVRNWFYEGFLHLHWMMGVAYFATLTWHVWGMLGTTNYMWTALAFWAAQLIYRIVVKTCFRPNALFLRPRPAKLFKLQGSKAFQINVENNKISWKPGQHAFLRFPTRILDNHPFSISSLPNTEESELKFVVVPKKGLTKELYNSIEQYSNTKVFVDGPYGGCSRDHNTFDKVFLIASGSGITATISFLTDLSLRIASGKNTVTKEINFIWIVRKYEDIDWFKTELNKALECRSVKINVDIYVCEENKSEKQDIAGAKEDSENEKVESSNEKASNEERSISKAESVEEKLETRSNQFNVKFFKPDIKNILAQFKYQIGRRNFIVSSGSESMQSQVAQTCSELQSFIFNNDKNHSNVEEVFLHTEAFHW